tara:strand:- start:6 stop:539 length:534 start_codon:yes stop_codon:yes gene_type:complete
MTKILYLFLSSLIFLNSFDVSAHGPSRQKYIEKIEINAKPQKVWEVVSKFDKYDWHPDVKSFTADGNEVGAKREIIFKDGSKISHSLEKLNIEKMMITWRIVETSQNILPVNSYSAMVKVTESKENPGKAEITFKSAFYRGFMGNDPPEHLNDENSKKKVIVFVKKSIDGIKNKLSK